MVEIGREKHKVATFKLFVKPECLVYIWKKGGNLGWWQKSFFSFYRQLQFIKIHVLLYEAFLFPSPEVRVYVISCRNKILRGYLNYYCICWSQPRPLCVKTHCSRSSSCFPWRLSSIPSFLVGAEVQVTSYEAAPAVNGVYGMISLFRAERWKLDFMLF